MKKIYLFVKGAKRWNSLLNKFSKLHKRIQLLLNSGNETQYNKLVKKLQSIYVKLEKMQYQTGIKVATTSLAIVLSAFTANAQFAAGELLTTGGPISIDYLSAPTFADIDGDGDLDLYIGGENGRVDIFTNDNGAFTRSSALQAGGTTIDVGYFSKPVFEDIDGDGDLDLYIGKDYGQIKTFTNNNGVFTAASDLQAGGTTIDVGSYSTPTFADIDGDGDLDLYVGTSDGSINVFTNNAGVFTAASDLQAGGIAIDVGSNSTPIFADIDGDGDLDLYVGEYSGAIKVFTNTNGVFTAASDLQAGGTAIDVGNSSTPTFADIDGDGDLDLYIGRYYGQIKTFTNNAGVFTAASDLEGGGIELDVGSYSTPTFEDIDGDGDLDLYIGKTTGKLDLLPNNNGVFFVREDQSIDVGASSKPIFADIDTDGDADLYIGNFDGKIKVFTNNNGVFTATIDLQAGGNDIDVGNEAKPTFADVDGDGDLDLYVGEQNGTIKVYSNNNGVFTVASDLQAGGTDIDVGSRANPTFADLDGDSDLDLYVGEYDGAIKVFTNNSGVFTAASDLQAGGTDIAVNKFSSPAFADIDGDSDLDLYVGDTYGIITFFENIPAGTIILVNSITIQGAGSASTITTQGGTLQMSATILPANADDATYTWTVTNGTGSATIDANGLLTATGDGTVTVTATANDASGETATYVVTISNQVAQAVLVNSITIQGVGNASTITTQGGTLQMSATILPANADDATYTWSVTNGTGSATIDANGLLTATGDGTVTVTATTNDGSGETATYVVTISNQSSSSVGINEVALNEVSIYPNPVKTQLFIELTNTVVNQLEIIDFSGKVVKSIINNVRSIDVSELNKGIYILKTSTENGVSATRFVKQ